MANIKLFLFVIFLIILPACAAEGGAAPAIPATDTPIPATETAVPPTDTPPPTLTPEPEIVLEPGSPARGQAIFENGGTHEAFEPSYYCIHCHSLDGSDGYGPTLQGIALAAGERVPGLTAEEYIRQSIMEPDAYVVEGYDSMGRILSKLLSEQEVNDLVAFLLTRDEAAVPPAAAPEAQVVLEASDPQRGSEIFLIGGADELYEPKFACVTCHSLDGSVGGEDGNGPSLLGVADRAAKRVPGLSAEEYLRQSILEPAAFLAPTYKNRMTKTGAKYLAEEELNDLVAFLLTLSGDAAAAGDIKPMPEVEIDLGMSIKEGNAARGEKLTAVTYRCLACHVDEAITGYGPRFSSTEDLPPIWQRGELRIADPGYAGQAATNQAYILESVFLPDVYLVPGEWAERMPNTYHLQLSDQELADIMAWLGTFE